MNKTVCLLLLSLFFSGLNKTRAQSTKISFQLGIQVPENGLDYTYKFTNFVSDTLEIEGAQNDPEKKFTTKIKLSEKQLGELYEGARQFMSSFVPGSNDSIRLSSNSFVVKLGVSQVTKSIEFSDTKYVKFLYPLINVLNSFVSKEQNLDLKAQSNMYGELFTDHSSTFMLEKKSWGAKPAKATYFFSSLQPADSLTCDNLMSSNRIYFPKAKKEELMADARKKILEIEFDPKSTVDPKKNVQSVALAVYQSGLAITVTITSADYLEKNPKIEAVITLMNASLDARHKIH